MKRFWWWLTDSELFFLAGVVLAAFILVGGVLVTGLKVTIDSARDYCGGVAERSGNPTEFKQYGPMGLAGYACFIQLDGEWWDLDNVIIDGEPLE